MEKRFSHTTGVSVMRLLDELEAACTIARLMHRNTQEVKNRVRELICRAASGRDAERGYSSVESIPLLHRIAKKQAEKIRACIQELRAPDEVTVMKLHTHAPALRIVRYEPETSSDFSAQ